MDVFTHFVLPYLVVWALGRPQRERLAAGIGGYAPDMDVATAVLGLLDERIWALGHRGFSHSLLGAPLYAVGVAALLSLPAWSRRWPRLAALRFDARMLALAVLFSYSHLALDVVTMWGVALYFPWSSARVSLDWYFDSVIWAVPFSAAFVVLLWRRASERRLRQVGAALVVVLLASGAARLAWRPAADDAVRVLPVGMEWQWAVVREHPAGYAVQPYAMGAPKGEVQVFVSRPPTGEADRLALEAAEASPLAKGFRLYAGWPVVVQVDARPEGGHNVTYTDVMRRAQFVGREGWWPTLHEIGVLRLVVDERGVREAD